MKFKKNNYQLPSWPLAVPSSLTLKSESPRWPDYAAETPVSAVSRLPFCLTVYQKTTQSSTIWPRNVYSAPSLGKTQMQNEASVNGKLYGGNNSACVTTAKKQQKINTATTFLAFSSSHLQANDLKKTIQLTSCSLVAQHIV